MMNRSTTARTAHTPCCFMTACYRAFLLEVMKKIKEQQLYVYLENMYENELLQLIKEKDCQNVEFIRGKLAMLDILKADSAINTLNMLDYAF